MPPAPSLGHPEITEVLPNVHRIGRLLLGVGGDRREIRAQRRGSPRPPAVLLSGVFWRPGVIVTAEHTIRREDEITVTLPDGSNAPATLAGSDPGTDLAVLKAEFPAPLLKPAAGPIAGQIVLAIGRSQDSGVNATLGIVSAVSGDWRTWRGGRLDQYIRLDLTLYPGSSGGAVVNIAGETLGIATSALSRIAGVTIPSATIDRVVDQILARGRVSRDDACSFITSLLLFLFLCSLARAYLAGRCVAASSPMRCECRGKRLRAGAGRRPAEWPLGRDATPSLW